MGLGDDGPRSEAAPARAELQAEPLFTGFGPFRLFPAERRLARNGETVPLGGRALDILILLVRNVGRVVTKQDLLSQVWQGVNVDESSLRAHIAALRRALGDGRDGSRYIINVAGQGYCFVHPIADAADLDPPRHLPPQSAGRERGSRLPRRSTPIIDREDDRSAIAELLARHRFVTIHGPGGIGKTTVALAVANQWEDAFGERVCFLDLGLLGISDSVPDALASDLGLTVRRSDPTMSVVSYLRDRHMLLVLDCCEHMIDSIAPLAEAIMHEAPHVRLLATSREPLRAEGEHVYVLPPLTIPPEDIPVSAEDMHNYPAAALFIERAFAGGLRRPLNDVDARIIADICRKVDGIALALELAAGRVSAHGLEETASLLDGRLKLLWQGRRTAVARHRTLNATLDWSHDLTSVAEQIVLRRLSVFVGPFTLAEAQAVACGEDLAGVEVVEALARLVAKSLVSVDPDGQPTRYRLLDSTRAYAHGKLVGSAEDAAFARRHAVFFMRYLEQAHGRGTGQPKKTKSPSAIHLGNIRSALEWCSSRPDEAELYVQLASYAAELFLDLDLLTECRRSCERALSAMETSMAGTVHEMLLQGSLGRALLLTDNTSGDTEAHYGRALEIAEALDDFPYQFRILDDLHVHYRRTCDLTRLLQVAERAMSIADRIPDPMAAATANLMLGASHHIAGNLASAQAALSGILRQRLIPTKAMSRLLDFQSKALLISARTLWLQGFPDRAVAAVREAEQYNPWGEVPACQALIISSDVFYFRRDWVTFERYLDRLIHHAGEASLEAYRWLGVGFKGEIAMRQGDVESGLSILRDSIAKLRAEKFELYIPWLQCAMAEGLALRGYTDQALYLVSELIDATRVRGGAYNLPELLRVYGELLADAGNEAEAERQFLQSTALAKEQGALSWRLRTATSLARLWSRHSRRNDARTMLAGVYTTFTEGFETGDLKEARLLLDRLVDPEDHP